MKATRAPRPPDRALRHRSSGSMQLARFQVARVPSRRAAGPPSAQGRSVLENARFWKTATVSHASRDDSRSLATALATSASLECTWRSAALGSSRTRCTRRPRAQCDLLPAAPEDQQAIAAVGADLAQGLECGPAAAVGRRGEQHDVRRPAADGLNGRESIAAGPGAVRLVHDDQVPSAGRQCRHAPPDA